MYKGIGVSKGIVIGRILVLLDQEINIEKKNIQCVDKEINKLVSAIEKSKAELVSIKEKAAENLSDDESAIFDAHIMLLEDDELISNALEAIKDKNVNCEYAFSEITNKYIAMFEAMDDEYMRERAADIKDVSNRVIRNILGIKKVDLSNIQDEVIIATHELTPSQTAVMKKDKVFGFLTDIGGRTSHTAIMARTLEIPAVVGLKDITLKVKDKDLVILDGEKGIVEVNPDEDTINYYKKLKEKYENEKNELKTLIEKETIPIGGEKVELAGNIGTPDDIDALIRNGAEGVGLFRTEFLYMNRDTFPTEDEQFEAYKKVLSSMNPKPVVIRTLDIGGDKELSYLKFDEEMNPFLGYRAIRLCLDQKEIFITQLKALLRASVYGKLKIMFPMISSLEELLKAKEIFEEVKKELKDNGKEISEDIEIGMMIEVPSAAIISDVLSEHVDFFSIGTNDLIQYTCAVDRMNEKIQYLYNPLNKAVLRLIKLVIDNGHKAGIWVGMCGEMAGEKKYIPILVGMGLDEFSMSPSSILPARKLINSLEFEKCSQIANNYL